MKFIETCKNDMIEYQTKKLSGILQAITNQDVSNEDIKILMNNKKNILETKEYIINNINDVFVALDSLLNKN